ncbi:hypothetical protein OG413_28285 [Streptomyces sp. NBC_01433]|uniref:hypothetical protein n=1 Tax=Streptomyces sp. NBC_01433 TaxID=2903864 RepID=UPI00225B4733|nr:hypothetical protein [Streptomyces sp. NBC_01433]MCX4679158.1 hypothetical protein [Streptomyces sp. NBC_01433]
MTDYLFTVLALLTLTGIYPGGVPGDDAGGPAGTGYRIDRGYLGPELAPALTGYTVCDTDDLRSLSDRLP